jgi:hypothetical protein
MSKRDEALLGISAVTFLLLCLWLGPDRAVFLLTVVAIVVGWYLLCRRFPIVGHFTAVFIGGFFSGLFNYRSGYNYRPLYRRRR